MAPLPGRRDHQSAYQLACRELSRIDDIAEQCRQSGARCRQTGNEKTITLEYLNQAYRITLPHVGVSLSGSSEPVSLKDKLLILHYFLRAEGSPLSGKIITYKELPEGFIYFPTFYKRSIKPIVDNFGRQPHRLLEASRNLGGRKADYGDMAVTINAFCRIPITIALWQGDNEFPPEGSILFDSTISGYLPTEDITVLCQIIAFRLIGFLG